MLSLIERQIETVENRLLLLAPERAVVPASFRQVVHDAEQHAELMRGLQRLRGAVYLDDGAIERRHLSEDGRHETSEDQRSWHLLIRSGDGRTSSCAWYMAHLGAISLQQLRVRHCPIGSRLRSTFEAAIRAELDRARSEGLHYAELGGWAIARESRCTAAGLVLALAAYGLGRVLGGALGVTTATVRHSSSTILRRLGGKSLHVGDEVVPSYYDNRYRCEMEVLRFDSRVPSPKYLAAIRAVQRRLVHVPVFACTAEQLAQTTCESAAA